MRIAALILALALSAPALAQCTAPILIHWSYASSHDQKELSDWWEQGGQVRYPQLCLTEKLDEAAYVLVLTRSTYNTNSTITIPHQQRERVDATISTWYGDAKLTGYATVTQYEIKQQPVQCDVVSAFIYVKNAPYPSAYAWRVYTSGSHAFFSSLGAGLIAGSGGSPPTLTACDLGSRKPVKDTVSAILKIASANPQQHLQPSKVVAATDFGGTYNGAWRSGKFNAGGTASMVMNISESEVRAEITLRGSRITKEVLYGKATENSDGWEVSLQTANGDLVANGTFKNGAFEGDYDYVPAADHGRWTLNKD
jgi:hypothetical protein